MALYNDSLMQGHAHGEARASAAIHPPDGSYSAMKSMLFVEPTGTVSHESLDEWLESARAFVLRLPTEKLAVRKSGIRWWPLNDYSCPGDRLELLDTATVTGNAFQFPGVAPVLGCAIVPDDASPAHATRADLGVCLRWQ